MLRIIFLGNDARSKRTAEIIGEKDRSLTSTILQNENQLIEHYDVYIFPIPMSLDGKTLNNSNVRLNTESIINNIPENALVLTGGKTVNGSIDIVNRDDFSYKNAIPTAEGAIALAITSTDISLTDSKILITGFGRVSKILLQKLCGLCSNITVALRNKSDMELIKTLGMKVIPIEKIADNIKSNNIIFNTVPHKIFTKEILLRAHNKNLFIELASNQLGFDTEAIKELNINYINAPGLPNKVAPITAAYILAETIMNILEEKNLI